MSDNSGAGHEYRTDGRFISCAGAGFGAAGQAGSAIAQSPSLAPYLDQPPPGLTPEPFAPGLVSSPGYEYGGVFSPDMDAFYFIRGRGESSAQDFVVFKYEDADWRETVLSPRVGQPFIAPDGDTLHLGGRYMERTDAGWSEIYSLGQPFDDFQISASHGVIRRNLCV